MYTVHLCQIYFIMWIDPKVYLVKPMFGSDLFFIALSLYSLYIQYDLNVTFTLVTSSENKQHVVIFLLCDFFLADTLWIMTSWPQNRRSLMSKMASFSSRIWCLRRTSTCLGEHQKLGKSQRTIVFSQHSSLLATLAEYSFSWYKWQQYYLKTATKIV